MKTKWPRDGILRWVISLLKLLEIVFYEKSKIIAFTCILYFRVEIIRLSDKSFKETIKDVELSSYRSTTKEGYVSLDPSKPLPHEYAEGKLSRYSDNARQKYLNSADIEGGGQQNNVFNEHEAKIVSQYAEPHDSVMLNKTEFREILMNALNVNSSISSVSHKLNSGSVEANAPKHDINQSIDVNRPEIKASSEHIASTTDDVIYLNQTIEKSSHTPIDAQKKTTPISLDTPEVDKLLNEGNF